MVNNIINNSGTEMKDMMNTDKWVYKYPGIKFDESKLVCSPRVWKDYFKDELYDDQYVLLFRFSDSDKRKGVNVFHVHVNNGEITDYKCIKSWIHGDRHQTKRELSRTI